MRHPDEFPVRLQLVVPLCLIACTALGPDDAPELPPDVDVAADVSAPFCLATDGAPLPFFCFLDATCVPAGARNPDNECEECNPRKDALAWSAVRNATDAGGIMECGGGQSGWFCFDGACCLPECAGRTCGSDGCGWKCGQGDCEPGYVCDHACRPVE
jgi:hypothetical protein